MEADIKARRARYIPRLILGLFDVFAVNASFFLAIIVRFYVNGVFNNSGEIYVSMFFSFAPVYTICCLVVFSLLGMYMFKWRYVGVNDLKMIFIANLITLLIHVAGTLIFIGRMPITYYCLGGFTQVFLTTTVRFIPRYILVDSNAGFNVQGTDSAGLVIMIIGIDENARMLQERIGISKRNINRVACILDYKKISGQGQIFNGLPIVSGIENMEAAIRKYGVNCAIITDGRIPEKIYDEIKDICGRTKTDMKKFIVGTEHIYSKIALSELMSVSSCSVKIDDGESQTAFPDGKAALRAIPSYQFVKSITTPGSYLLVTVDKKAAPSDDPNAEWKKKYVEENNMEISYF